MSTSSVASTSGLSPIKPLSAKVPGFDELSPVSIASGIVSFGSSIARASAGGSTITGMVFLIIETSLSVSLASAESNSSESPAATVPTSESINRKAEE